MSLQDLQYHQRDMAALEWSRDFTIWTNTERRDEIYVERRDLEELTYQIKSSATPKNKDPFAGMGGGKAAEPLPKHIQDSLAPLYEKIEALAKELDSLIDKEATARERSKRLQYALGVATM
jgi:hypothetical protein